MIFWKKCDESSFRDEIYIYTSGGIIGIMLFVRGYSGKKFFVK